MQKKMHLLPLCMLKQGQAGRGTIPSEYVIVEKGLQHLPFYEALYLNDFAPDDRFE